MSDQFDSDKRCACCDTPLPNFALMLLCGECFYAAVKENDGTDMKCSLHGGAWDPRKVVTGR